MIEFAFDSPGRETLDLYRRRGAAAARVLSGLPAFDVVTAGLWPNPRLAFSGSVLGVGRDKPQGPFYNWAPQVSVPLPIFGQISARKREALAALHVAEVNVAAALWSRAADLEQTMVERAFADAEVQEIERNQRELTRIDDIVRTRAALALTLATTCCACRPPKPPSARR